MAMDKANKLIEKKFQIDKLTINRELDAVLIMHLVIDDLKLPYKLRDIKRAANLEKNIPNEGLIKNRKKLKRHFKSWFKNYKTPQDEMPKICE